MRGPDGVWRQQSELLRAIKPSQGIEIDRYGIAYRVPSPTDLKLGAPWRSDWKKK